MATVTLPSLRSLGHDLDTSENRFGFLRDSSPLRDDPAALRERFEEDGYLYMRGFFERSLITEARGEVFRKLAEQGELDPDYDPMEGRLSGEGRNGGLRPQMAQTSEAVKRVVFGPEIVDFYTRFFDEPIRHFDYIWARLMGRGQGTPAHCDWVYMGRGSRQLMTCWIPYVEVPLEMGGLMVLEGSHRQRERIRHYLEKDVDAYCENRESDVQKVAVEGGWSFPGWLSQRPDTLAERFDARWLTAECWQPGDFLTFRMDLIHGSLDNQTDRVRFSTDTRYQPASHPADERWIGPNPAGHSRAGKKGRIC